MVEVGEQHLDLRARPGIRDRDVGPRPDQRSRRRLRTCGGIASAQARQAIEEPARSARSSRPGTGQRPHDAHEGVLGEVVGVLAADQVRAQAPYVGLAGAGRPPRT